MESTGRSAAITAVVITATFDDDKVVDTEEVDDDNEPTPVTSTPVTEVVTPECLLGTDVAAPFPALRLPPVDGFKPNIQTRCYKKKNLTV